ncbi:putative membrane protein YccC [Kushneria sinocarnis]|uniref:Putative membrane protein YccC n=1 Tax=Kushneria sinocarnis TaxID=595502 RepID=A0A420WWS5_9GAMM|nr:FUSC family protein [Kushneria sinocarnis]RKR04191.1 putative membrane protein YccC [Kushneria sinocarnis]
MKLGPKLGVYLTPDINTLRFAFKGVLAMSLALYLAMLMSLDRPYWAVISAVFLQIRPQSGLVIEKGICQIGGTLIGGAVGIIIMAQFMQLPGLGLMFLMIWICLNAAVSTLTRNNNLTYGFAIGAATAALIVLIPMISNNSSYGVFQTAVARMSEIGLGATCATLVSMLVWPVRVREVVNGHASQVIDKAFAALEAELDPEVSLGRAQGMTVEALQAAVTLNTDSSAIIYEGPEGPGRARAAQLLAQRTLTLLSEMQVSGRLVRNHSELMTDSMKAVLEDIRRTFSRLRSLENTEERRRVLNALRRRVQDADLTSASSGSHLQRRLGQALHELLNCAHVMVQARGAIRHTSTMRLRARRFAHHRDYLQAMNTALRAGVLFIIGAVIYVGTQWNSAVLMMILPVIFGIMFNRFPNPTVMIRNVLKGGVLGLVAALVFGYVFLAQSTGFYEMLALIFGVPLFFGLMGIANFVTLPYALGFSILFVITVQPSNDMTFSVVSFFNRAVAVILGLIILWTVFRLFPGPGPLVMRRRAIGAITDDLLHLWEHSQKHSRESTADWFNGRMIERIQRLSGHDSALPEDERYLLDMGLSGLNLGHLILRMNRRISTNDDTPRVRATLRRWQYTLARAYEHSAWGEYDETFERDGAQLVSALRGSGRLDSDQIDLLEGLNERLVITLRRYANLSAESPEPEIRPALGREDN